MLAEGPCSAGSLASNFDVGRPAVSEHLQVLRRVALVRGEIRGRERIYELDAAPLADVGAWLQPFEKYWRSRLTDLKTYLEEEDAQ